ncbi:hypothetical protein [Sphingobium sp. YR657]|uniref:hypothetical protein n=1 Tax=Sphingobium sp. YR657 TaxID=1884366 RepID=UPI003137C1AD
MSRMLNKAEKLASIFDSADIVNALLTRTHGAEADAMRTLQSKLTDYRTIFDVIGDEAIIAQIRAGTYQGTVGHWVNQAFQKFGVVRLPAGVYRIGPDAPIVPSNDHQWLVGDGPGLTIIEGVGAGFAVIDCTTKTDFMVDGLTIQRTVAAKPAGVPAYTVNDGATAYRLSDSHGCGMNNVVIKGIWDVALDWRGHLPGQANHQYIYMLDRVSIEAECRISFAVGMIGGPVQELFISRLQIRGGTVDGLVFYNASGVYPLVISILQGHTALAARPGVGQVVRYLRGFNLVADSTDGPCVVIDTSAGGIAETWDGEIWGASSKDEHGVYAIEGAGTINGMKLSITGTNSKKCGIFWQGGSRLDFELQVGKNSTAGSALYPNVKFVGVQDFYVDGYAAGVGSSDFPELASYAISIDADCRDGHIIDCGCDGTVLGPIEDLAPDTIIERCVGVVTEVVVAVTIAVGNNSGSAPHGLTLLPTLKDVISVEPLNPPPTSGLGTAPIKAGIDATVVALVCDPPIPSGAAPMLCDVRIKTRSGAKIL